MRNNENYERRRRPNKRSRRARRRKRQRRLFTTGALALLIACTVVGAYFYYDYARRVYDKCVVELGSTIKATDFLKDPSQEAYFTSDTDVPTNQAGTFKVGIKTGHYRYRCKLEVVDTVAPEVTVKDVTRIMSEKPSATDFVKEAKDLSGQVNVYFANDISMDALGEFPVTIVAEDPSGNKTESQATLKIVNEYNKVPPVFEGQLDKTIYTGSGVSYKTGVVAIDDEDANVDFTVDSSQVDLDTPGTYTVTYSATDSMGNVGTATGTITVIKNEYGQGQVDELADQVLAQIITDGMSDYDKAQAIFSWVQMNMGYSESNDHDDWLKAAYNAFTKRHGDCYNYFAVSKELLTRAGIKNEDIEIIPTATRHHYWNVIDCGEGWRHFDTTPRVDKTFKGFYLTDAELTEYSTTHRNTHNFDRDVYTYFN
ncbi:MAG: DUF5011 domain-containing protein [Pseudobutyrivibrio sp.]|nr:DUF5011 domain-containing protein [Pseudobutyrivibrio sp.]